MGQARARIVTAAERRRVSDEPLAIELGRPSQSKEQAAFLQCELKARRSAVGRQRTGTLARFEFLLLGSKIDITDVEKEGAGRGESVRALLDQLFGNVDPCALEALETTTVFATFAVPFDAASVEHLGPFREFQAVDAAVRSRLEAGHSLPEVSVALRPPDPASAFQYVDAVARAALDLTTPRRTGSSPGRAGHWSPGRATRDHASPLSPRWWWRRSGP